MLKRLINDVTKSDTWKSQLTIAINVISSKNNDEERIIHSKSDNWLKNKKTNNKPNQ